MHKSRVLVFIKMKKELVLSRVILRIAVPIAIVVVFGFFIARDFARIQKKLSANFVVHGLEVQREKVKAKAAMITINHYRPDLTLWKDYILQDAALDASFLKDSVRYYDLISDYAPKMAEVYHLLGLCHYFLGENEKALAEQKKAVGLEPRFFYGWYNLGIMEYRAHNYTAAAEDFKMALRLPPEAAARILGSSRIYIEIVRGAGVEKAFNGQRIQDSYRDAYKMLAASMNRLRGQMVSPEDEKAAPKVF